MGNPGRGQNAKYPTNIPPSSPGYAVPSQETLKTVAHASKKEKLAREYT